MKKLMKVGLLSLVILGALVTRPQKAHALRCWSIDTGNGPATCCVWAGQAQCAED